MDNNVNVPNKDGMAVAALITGIVSVAGCFIPYVSYFAFACGILAMIFSVKAKKNTTKRGMCTAGLVLGIIGLALSLIAIICVICAIGTIAGLGEAATSLQ